MPWAGVCGVVQYDARRVLSGGQRTLGLRTSLLGPDPLPMTTLDRRHQLARRIFQGTLTFTTGLTVFWIWVLVTRTDTAFFPYQPITLEALAQVAAGISIFHLGWGVVWYGVKASLLKRFVGFTKDERRAAFSSRLRLPFDVSDLTARYSERRIRIADMVGRRGRFATIALAGFFYLYQQVAAGRAENFASFFLQQNLFDAVVTSWMFLALFRSDTWVAGVLYGSAARVMDGVLARSNMLLITTLWTAFKFVLVPIGGALARVYPPEQFAVVFALIWGSYIVTDALAEIGGSLYGKQTLRVWGIGDVNRKSVGGTLTGFVGCLLFCAWLVWAHQLPPVWLALGLLISVSNTLVELFAPRGTDDFFMATTNAIVCLAFAHVLNGV